eukprot:g3186.t1
MGNRQTKVATTTTREVTQIPEKIEAESSEPTGTNVKSENAAFVPETPPQPTESLLKRPVDDPVETQETRREQTVEFTDDKERGVNTEGVLESTPVEISEAESVDGEIQNLDKNEIESPVEEQETRTAVPVEEQDAKCEIQTTVIVEMKTQEMSSIPIENETKEVIQQTVAEVVSEDTNEVEVVQDDTPMMSVEKVQGEVPETTPVLIAKESSEPVPEETKQEAVEAKTPDILETVAKKSPDIISGEKNEASMEARNEVVHEKPLPESSILEETPEAISKEAPEVVTDTTENVIVEENLDEIIITETTKLVSETTQEDVQENEKSAEVVSKETPEVVAKTTENVIVEENLDEIIITETPKLVSETTQEVVQENEKSAEVDSKETPEKVADTAKTTENVTVEENSADVIKETPELVSETTKAEDVQENSPEIVSSEPPEMIVEITKELTPENTPLLETAQHNSAEPVSDNPSRVILDESKAAAPFNEVDIIIPDSTPPFPSITMETASISSSSTAMKTDEEYMKGIMGTSLAYPNVTSNESVIGSLAVSEHTLDESQWDNNTCPENSSTLKDSVEEDPSIHQDLLVGDQNIEVVLTTPDPVQQDDQIKPEVIPEKVFSKSRSSDLDVDIFVCVDLYEENGVVKLGMKCVSMPTISTASSMISGKEVSVELPTPFEDDVKDESPSITESKSGDLISDTKPNSSMEKSKLKKPKKSSSTKSTSSVRSPKTPNSESSTPPVPLKKSPSSSSSTSSQSRLPKSSSTSSNSGRGRGPSRGRGRGRARKTQ